MKAKYIYEKFTEDSDPISDLGIGITRILKKDHYEIGRMFPSVSSKKYFGTGQWGNEMFAIYIFLDIILETLQYRYRKQSNINQEDIDYAFERTKEYKLQRRELKLFVNFEKVKEFLKDHYGFEINENNVTENLNEKFSEDSDPIHELGIGSLGFLEKEYKEEARTSSSTGSKKFFGTPKYEREAFFIYLLLGRLVETLRNKGELSQEDIDNAFERTKNYRYHGKEMKHKTNLNKVREAMKNYYHINISDDEIKENLNEKFSEDSDPVTDLNIGGVVLQDLFDETRKNQLKQIEKIKKSMHKKYESYLRELFMGKTITANMKRLATYDAKTMKKVTDPAEGKFTIKVIDIAVEDYDYEYNNYIMIAGDDRGIYRLSMNKKVYISDK